ncbi:hypothetical protein GMDG_00934 [Pseudogymnoascus destructans 20631-21]|uniref:Uncharacterized protein n=1 Tax=Pseudogymnoascus destructans (strain ATCC MYA-4855 / 20631-21) TaxID=658429 RepID=L8FLQ2_PSED2|nr:hypothetical protein GMDG_00934 [Pseudogymnoascus destructans 20631-21]
MTFDDTTNQLRYPTSIEGRKNTMASRDPSPSPSPWRWPSLSKDRLITLLAADLLLLTSVLTTLLLPHIPSPLLYPVWGLAKAYAIYLQLLVLPCLLGIWGAVKESPLPTTILSTTLLIDALLSLPPRLLLIASLARAPARCGAPGTPAQGIIWTGCADAAIGPIVVVVVVVVASGLEAWGGWWVRGWGRRLGVEQRKEREEEGEGGKERFCDEV